jgi:transcriptional regulator with XRE-family HTH domain
LAVVAPNRQLRERRTGLPLTQEELAAAVGVSDITIRRWEAGQRPQPLHVRRLCEILEATPGELGFGPELQAFSALGALEIDPDDVPAPEDVEAAVHRLRRSYSTTPPAELQRRIEVRLRQVKRLLSGQARASSRGNLLQAAAWLALLRGTVLTDLKDYEAAETSVHVARQLAYEIGHVELQAWTWETAAWMAATDGRQHDARDMASRGIDVAPRGGYGLVAVTLQRARIRGALGDEPGVREDLEAGRRAWTAAGDPEWPDDHYQIDHAKVAYFGSGAMVGLRRPREAIELASEVIEANQNPATRNWWPMRVANARLELAVARADLGEEDEAAALAEQALEPQWLRPDTERRTRMLLSRMRDPKLRAYVAEQLDHAVSSTP